jgi:hypothetical protein
MATTIAGVAMAGGGGFVLKSVRTGDVRENNVQTFSVQNEGDFCIITNESFSSSIKFDISQIDDISVDIRTQAPDIVFGKNIVVKAKGSSISYHIYEYGPAE